jgi:acyl carrier protein
VSGEEEGYVAPRTELEEALVALWQEVLGVERVGVADNFFALGGHSLKATQIMARVQERYGVRVPLRALFEDATVARLAAVLEQMRDQAAEDGGPITATARGTDTLDTLLAQLEQLSDDDLLGESVASTASAALNNRTRRI